MVFALENLSTYLGYFGDVITWAAGEFIDVMNIILDSPLIIAIGIGLFIMFVRYAWRFLRSISGGGE